MAQSATFSVPMDTETAAGVFRGIDRRVGGVGAHPDTLHDAVDCDLTIGGRLRGRDRLDPVAVLPAGTIGLYTLGRQLRVAAPAGYGFQFFMPPGIRADIFGISESAPTPIVPSRVSSMTNFGVTDQSEPSPYLLIESDGQVFHHWLQTTPVAADEYLDTRVTLPFSSGPDIIKLNGRLWAANAGDGRVHYSSVENGPTQDGWSEIESPGDAGHLNPLHHAMSDPAIQGLAHHQGRLLIVYDNAIQIWDVPPDPEDHRFLTAYHGPGTRQFPSLQNVIGDIFYFSQGGFRSLQTQMVTGELREGDIGAPIQELTRPFEVIEAGRVKSIWSQARSQYLCAINDADDAEGCTVFAFTHTATGITGWTRWRLPIAVDYFTEHESDLYVRRGDVVYRMTTADPICSDLVGADATPIAVRPRVDLQFLHGGNPRRMKSWLMLDVNQHGTCDIQMLTDPDDLSIVEDVAFNVSGSTYDGGSIPIQAVANAIALRFTAKTAWELRRLDFDVQHLAM